MPSNRSMPPGQIIPELPCGDVVAASAWLCTAFGFSERLRIGTHRVQLRFGAGSVVLLAGRPAAPSSLMVRVEDVDAHFERARAAGAQIVGPLTSHPYGERQYSAEDPSGHRWTFSESVADIDPRQWGGELIEDERSG